MISGSIDCFRDTFWGCFTFERVVSNVGQMNGRVVFNALDQDRVQYSESGVYVGVMEGADFFQNQTYSICFPHLNIYNHRGDLLHRLTCQEDGEYPQVLTHVHTCKQDTYVATFSLISSDEFRTYYDVQGPHKNYQIDTRFVREVHDDAN